MNNNIKLQARLLFKGRTEIVKIGKSFDKLVALLSIILEKEDNRTIGEIFDLTERKVVYRCRRNACE